MLSLIVSGRSSIKDDAPFTRSGEWRWFTSGLWDSEYPSGSGVERLASPRPDFMSMSSANTKTERVSFEVLHSSNLSHQFRVVGVPEMISRSWFSFHWKYADAGTGVAREALTASSAIKLY